MARCIKGHGTLKLKNTALRARPSTPTGAGKGKAKKKPKTRQEVRGCGVQGHPDPLG